MPILVPYVKYLINICYIYVLYILDKFGQVCYDALLQIRQCRQTKPSARTLSIKIQFKNSKALAG